MVAPWFVVLICIAHIASGWKSIFRWKPLQITAQKGRYLTKLQSTLTDKVWWKDGLQFSCTGCGRCCQNDGEVWFDTDEFFDLCKLLNITFEEAIDKYTESVHSGWIKIKNKIPNGVDDDQCVFLDKDGKSCSVYEARPIQCRTYPYWPSLLVNSSAWDNEAVVPDSVVGKHWSREQGGCEGINNVEAEVVQPDTIRRNNEVYRRYTDQYPLTMTLPSPSDRPRLLAKLDIIKSVSRSTDAWLDSFATNFKLPPFHLPSPSAASTYRQRVFFGTEAVKILARLNYEVLVLLTERAETLPGIVLTLPFAFQDIEQFQRFEREWRVADLAKRRLEARQQRTTSGSEINQSDTAVRKISQRPSLRDRIASQKSSKLEAAEILKGNQYAYYRSVTDDRDAVGEGVSAPYELHFFHPQFVYESDGGHSDDGDDDDGESDEETDEKEEGDGDDIELMDANDSANPRDFLRRSPFPTVVILRCDPASHSVIRRNSTAASLDLLGAADFGALQAEMERCIRLSVGWT